MLSHATFVRTAVAVSGLSFVKRRCLDRVGREPET